MASDRVLILASASPRRADLLRAARISFRICVPRIREALALDFPSWTPRRLAIHNASRKAATIARRFPDRWVLGADTVVVLGRSLFGKPRTQVEAEAMLARLQGRTHRVITGVALLRRDAPPRTFAVTTRVTFKRLDARGIQDYLRRIDPFDKAGAYAAQSHTELLIHRVEGSSSNVVGLPMERVLLEWRRCCGQIQTTRGRVSPVKRAR